MSIEYEGYKRVYLTDDEMADFYSDLAAHSDKLVEHFDLLENQFLIIYSLDKEVKDKFVCQNGKLRKVTYHTLGGSYNLIKPRNIEQELAFDMMKDPRTTVKLITGDFGSGKTLILCSAAVEALEKGKFDKIIWLRNNVQLKDTDQIGALPGEALDKLLPYAMPLADHIGGVEGLMNFVEKGQIEILPLGFVRGRSIRNSIVICSEAENLTKAHLKLLIGRIDEGSMIWLDADCQQRDKSVFEKSAGLEKMVECLKGEDLFQYVHLVDIERSATARLAELID